MAKPGTKTVPARKDPSRRDDDSLLVKSAESLGRVIGSLQRQVQGGSKQFATLTSDALESLPELPRFDDVFGTTKTAPPRKRTKRARKPPASRTKTTRTATTAARAKKAGRSSKRAPARKTAKKR